MLRWLPKWTGAAGKVRQPTSGLGQVWVGWWMVALGWVWVGWWAVGLGRVWVGWWMVALGWVWVGWWMVALGRVWVGWWEVGLGSEKWGMGLAASWEFPQRLALLGQLRRNLTKGQQPRWWQSSEANGGEWVRRASFPFSRNRCAVGLTGCLGSAVLIDRPAATRGYDRGSYGTAGDCCGEGDEPSGCDSL